MGDIAASPQNIGATAQPRNRRFLGEDTSCNKKPAWCGWEMTQRSLTIAMHATVGAMASLHATVGAMASLQVTANLHRWRSRLHTKYAVRHADGRLGGLVAACMDAAVSGRKRLGAPVPVAFCPALSCQQITTLAASIHGARHCHGWVRIKPPWQAAIPLIFHYPQSNALVCKALGRVLVLRALGTIPGSCKEVKDV